LLIGSVGASAGTAASAGAELLVGDARAPGADDEARGESPLAGRAAGVERYGDRKHGVTGGSDDTDETD
jgi:hypothetical protein